MAVTPPTGNAAPAALANTVRDLCTTLNLFGARLLAPGETPPRDNSCTNLLLLAGAHGGVVPLVANGRMVGAPGATVTQLSVFRVDCKVEGVTYDGSKLAPATPLVTVPAGVTVCFERCHFARPSMAGEHVRVEAGGMAHFYGCSFGPAGLPAGAIPINNLGGAANVSVHGGSNKTGQAHVNVTGFGETT
jgi:hypothetical protein